METLIDANIFTAKMPAKNTSNIRNGHIVIGRRVGKARSDAYLKRGSTITKVAEELHIITGAHVKVHIVPTWQQGKAHLYKSRNFPIFEEGFLLIFCSLLVKCGKT